MLILLIILLLFLFYFLYSLKESFVIFYKKNRSLDQYIKKWYEYLDLFKLVRYFDHHVCYHGTVIDNSTLRSKFIHIIFDGEPLNLSHLTLSNNTILCTTKKELLPSDSNESNTVYIPYWLFYTMMDEDTNDKFKKVLTSNISEKSDIPFNKRSLCLFAYSNCKEHIHRGVHFRNNFYKELYKKFGHIDSIGKCMNNIPISDKKNNFVFINNFKVMKKYKFVISIENNFIDGYTTEKMMNPILSGSIPIYMGDPSITKVFNEDRFIHLRNFMTKDEKIDYKSLVKRLNDISNDEKIFDSIVKRPIFKTPVIDLEQEKKNIWRLLQNVGLPRRFILCTFADGIKYKSDRILKEAITSHYFTETISYNPSDLDGDFVKRHQHLFDKKGYGYWIWKPYIIDKLLKTMEEGDILMYCDSGCKIRENKINEMMSYIRSVNSNSSGILGFKIEHKNRHWTKRDTIEAIVNDYKELDEIGILESYQFAGGTFVIRKCSKSLEFVDRWIYYCNQYHLLDDSISITGEREDFKQHRHDQSIFTLLGNVFDVAYTLDNFEEKKNQSNGPIVWSRKKR